MPSQSMGQGPLESASLLTCKLDRFLTVQSGEVQSKAVKSVPLTAAEFAAILYQKRHPRKVLVPMHSGSRKHEKQSAILP